jgi:RNA 3'-terminal phosphate cyclase (ATP)
MLTLDGSQGEGGGQILRTALALSMVTSTPFRIERIRARRERPGLRRQHLTAVGAAAEVCKAEVEGAVLGSGELTFRPGAVVPGSYAFAIGTAGSTTLVLETVLPALLTAPGPSRLTLEGGTHNPLAPPFDFLEKTFLPLCCRMGPRIEARLERPGFYPAGGGRFTVAVEPAPRLEPLSLVVRGPILSRRARAVVANLPLSIALRELKVLARRLSLERAEMAAEETRGSHGPGNFVTLELVSAAVTEVVTGFGERGVRAETVAERVVEEASEYLAAEVPVGRHLADQLLLPLALAGGGVFQTLSPTLHTLTNLEVIRRFLGVEIAVIQTSARGWSVTVARRC